MSSNTNTPAAKLNFPLASSLPKTKAAQPKLVDLVAQLLDDPVIEAQIATYTHNGMVTGHPSFDRAAAADTLIEADMTGALKRMGPAMKWRIALAISTVQRRTFDMHKGKVTGLNQKTQALLLQQAQASAMPSETDAA